MIDCKISDERIVDTKLLEKILTKLLEEYIVPWIQGTCGLAPVNAKEIVRRVIREAIEEVSSSSCFLH